MVDIEIIELLERKNLDSAKRLFIQTIKTQEDMFDIVYKAFFLHKDIIGKQIIDFKFIISTRNNNIRYYSPYNFFCTICNNNELNILFRIIDDEYFWKKNSVIFDPGYSQTPRQWLIATAGYIFCTQNNISSLEILCNRYNITKFDAEKTHFFEVASNNNSDELFNFLINRYGNYVTNESNNIAETSLYDIPKYNDNSNAVNNPMYQINKNINNSIENPIYYR